MNEPEHQQLGELNLNHQAAFGNALRAALSNPDTQITEAGRFDQLLTDIAQELKMKLGRNPQFLEMDSALQTAELAKIDTIAAQFKDIYEKATQRLNQEVQNLRDQADQLPRMFNDLLAARGSNDVINQRAQAIKQHLTETMPATLDRLGQTILKKDIIQQVKQKVANLQDQLPFFVLDVTVGSVTDHHAIVTSEIGQLQALLDTIQV